MGFQSFCLRKWIHQKHWCSSIRREGRGDLTHVSPYLRIWISLIFTIVGYGRERRGDNNRSDRGCMIFDRMKNSTGALNSCCLRGGTETRNVSVKYRDIKRYDHVPGSTMSLIGSGVSWGKGLAVWITASKGGSETTASSKASCQYRGNHQGQPSSNRAEKADVYVRLTYHRF